MAFLHTLIARIIAFFKSRDLDDDFERELESHVVMLTDDNIRRGMSPGDARRAALIRLGAQSSLKDQHRMTRGLPLLETDISKSR